MVRNTKPLHARMCRIWPSTVAGGRPILVSYKPFSTESTFFLFFFFRLTLTWSHVQKTKKAHSRTGFGKPAIPPRNPVLIRHGRTTSTAHQIVAKAGFLFTRPSLSLPRTCSPASSSRTIITCDWSSKTRATTRPDGLVLPIPSR